MTVCLLFVLMAGLTWSAITLAANTGATLTSAPDKCISLRKGQNCYQKIWVQWTAPRIGDYCLIQQTHERPIRCWQNIAAGGARFEFVSKTSAILQLVDMSTGQDLANIEIKLAWVYRERKRSKRSWRLF